LQNCYSKKKQHCSHQFCIETTKGLSWGDKEELTLNAFALQLSRLHQRLIKKFTSTAFRLWISIRRI